jgi:endonuclease/exonuclease/phosphatase family metal-dependent hydrolase
MLSGRKLRICNVHLDHRSDEARVLGTRLLLREIEIDNGVNPLETVILGDMNARPDFSTIDEFRGSALGLTDLTEKIDVSFHAFGSKAAKIDYVFATGSLSEDYVSSRIWDDVHSGIYLSDHYPIEVSFK